MDERFHNRAAGEFHDSLRSTVELHEPSGIWFPVSLDYHRTINGILSMREQVDISVHSLNTELDPGVFSLGGIKQLSPGTRVLKYRAEGGVERDRMEWDGRQIVKSGVRSESENPKVGPVSNPGTTSAASPSPFEESPPAESSSPGASSPQAAETVLHSTGIEFVRVPAGGFVMGDLRDGVRIKDKVKPHEVQISRPFEMSRYEITVGQFRLLVEATNRITDSEAAAGSVRGFDRKHSSFIDNGSFNWRSPGYEQSDRHPVVYVSRDDAMEFCKWLTTTDSDGRTYRLPTEAEWEYACRAGTKTRFSCGDDPKGQAGFANVADQALTRVWPESPFELKLHDKHPFTAPVGSFKPNPFGLCDMHGNVWEWCSDKYSRRYYARSPVQDPTGPKVGRTYAARGGSWASFIADSSFRNSWKGNVGRADFGFRVVREL
jgi:sulfatase modifying factor 1